MNNLCKLLLQFPTYWERNIRDSVPSPNIGERVSPVPYKDRPPWVLINDNMKKRHAVEVQTSPPLLSRTAPAGTRSVPYTRTTGVRPIAVSATAHARLLRAL